MNMLVAKFTLRKQLSSLYLEMLIPCDSYCSYNVHQMAQKSLNLDKLNKNKNFSKTYLTGKRNSC